MCGSAEVRPHPWRTPVKCPRQKRKIPNKEYTERKNTYNRRTERKNTYNRRKERKTCMSHTYTHIYIYLYVYIYISNSFKDIQPYTTV